MFVIAVAGGSGSGKTTLARSVAERFAPDSLYIEHDRYYRDLSHLPVAERAATNFDEPAALESDRLVRDLNSLRSDQPTELPVYDFGSHTRIGSAPARPGRVVILDGILVLADSSLRAACDWRIFVDTPADVRLARRLRRDLIERERSVESVLDQYLRTVRPMHQRHVEPTREFADLVLHGDRPEAEILAHCLRELAERIPAAPTD